jgi:hypothetical protein
MLSSDYVQSLSMSESDNGSASASDGSASDSDASSSGNSKVVNAAQSDIPSSIDPQITFLASGLCMLMFAKKRTNKSSFGMQGAAQRDSLDSDSDSEEGPAPLRKGHAAGVSSPAPRQAASMDSPSGAGSEGYTDKRSGQEDVSQGRHSHSSSEKSLESGEGHRAAACGTARRAARQEPAEHDAIAEGDKELLHILQETTNMASPLAACAAAAAPAKRKLSRIVQRSAATAASVPVHAAGLEDLEDDV